VHVSSKLFRAVKSVERVVRRRLEAQRYRGEMGDKCGVC